MSFQPTQSLIDALRLADQVSCPYERRYKKNTRYQRTQRSSIARSMPTLIEDKKIPVFNNAPRKSIGATSDLYVEKEEGKPRMSVETVVGHKFAVGQKFMTGHVDKMRNAQAWAEKQFNKAHQFIRELSVSQADPKDIFAQ
ncbi:Protein CBG02069 [Caenorhabditis briggsae]|uniref:Protein CBG02069 n=1 Tax=Caenorhabditis briggsae TaxID=6238 RepID=A8WRX4_CAEBR|nr:Protein CBG02069 [Caenorhabditis briggsae]CAP23232.1 Protein CBG02069 [Caenorhabditis briggsae]